MTNLPSPAVFRQASPSAVRWIVVGVFSFLTVAFTVPAPAEVISIELTQPTTIPATDPATDPVDRLWMISTRHLKASTCRAHLDRPDLRVYQLDECGRAMPAGLDGLDGFLQNRNANRLVVIYVHGNRMDSSCDAIGRAIAVRRSTMRELRDRKNTAIDWVVWSWPSEKQGILLEDVRIKAERTDTQGLYLAWLLREQLSLGQPTAMIGYSFGGRVVTGALHALAGGALGRRVLSGESINGAEIPVGLVAPAIESGWLANGGYHELATQNMASVRLLYNRRDVVLKNYWRLDRIRNADALGYSGPTSFAPKFDGMRLPVESRDCAATVGRRHDELDYYSGRCGGGRVMADMLSTRLQIKSAGR